MNLAELATVKSRLGIETHDVTDDAQLNAFIAFASGRFAEECKRSFDRQEDVTQEFDADAAELVVNRYPIEAVSAFHLKANETDGWEEQSGVEYLLRGSARGIPCIISLPGPLGSSRELLRVTYTGGYVLPGTTAEEGQTELPEELEKACVEQVAHWWQRRNQLGLAGVSGQGGSFQASPTSVVKPLDLLPQVAALLRSYELFRL